MKDGRIPILRADYSHIKAIDFTNAHTASSFAACVLIPFMPSIFYTAGALGYFGYGMFVLITVFYKNLPTITLKTSPKILEIDLLENGQL